MIDPIQGRAGIGHDSNEDEQVKLKGHKHCCLQVFVDNLVHGDLHPGNLLVQNITTGTATGDQVRVMMVDIGCDTFVMDVQPDPNPLRICFLDCGVTSRLTEQNLARIRAVFKQVVIGDVRI